ncbi:hypothetical protein TorRG33x02_330640, partial [Trema orientale]
MGTRCKLDMKHETNRLKKIWNLRYKCGDSQLDQKLNASEIETDCSGFEPSR